MSFLLFILHILNPRYDVCSCLSQSEDISLFGEDAVAKSVWQGVP